MTDLPAPGSAGHAKSRLERVFDSDLWWSFKRSKSAIGAAVALVIVMLTAIFAPLLSPQNPYDLASLDLWNAELPPVWMEGGTMPFNLRTDVQGHDILSGSLYGTRISIFIGLAILIEATLSFLGVGMPPNQPSLGTLIRVGNQYLFPARGGSCSFRRSSSAFWWWRRTCWTTGCATRSIRNFDKEQHFS